jgi:hypothetical protein
MRERAAEGPLFSNSARIHNARGAVAVAGDQLGETTLKPSAYTVEARLGHFPSYPRSRLVNLRRSNDAFGKHP